MFGLAFILASCATLPRVITGPDFTAYQGEGLRTYLSWVFEIGFVAEDEAEARAYYQSALRELGVLFGRGVLTGRAFCDAASQPCPQQVRDLSFDKRFGSVDEDLENFPGPVLKVLAYWVRPVPGKPTLREYELWATFNPKETGWGQFDMFRVILEDPKATAETEASVFARRAKVREIEYIGIQL
jgi:hypothetical protein